MAVTRLKPAFKDARGLITDILTHVPVDAITIISTKKGGIRGNHFHKKTRQYTYLVSGKMKYYTRKPGRKAQVRVVKPGDLMDSPPGESHAFRALEDSVFLSISKGPRRGTDFEADTFRLTPPLAAA